MADKEKVLSIAVPSGDVWHPDFAMSLITMQSHMHQHGVKGMKQYFVINERSSMLVQNRNNLVKAAIKDGATHMLFLDADMVFPPDTAQWLMQHDKPVVLANYVNRSVPCRPISKDFNKKRVATTMESTGLEQVWFGGFGVCLIDLSVFDRIEWPWFDMCWMEDGGLVGEDVYFFNKLREKDIPVYVDHDLSKHVNHIGSFEYNNFMAESDDEDSSRIIHAV